MTDTSLAEPSWVESQFWPE